ncbi:MULTISPECIES: ABC transporter substrate-binding protein [Marinobacter]|uniref:ABC transporter substrate-binding protein n=1 Tax=Marinobacter TaxID=2742 RepID=UPI00222E633E|nr:ABC transporter substrate-binding protein [Marinobacter sp. AN1]UZD64586.1 ABC transporter substrate-binding protein [Marinobacter sp. AN1]
MNYKNIVRTVGMSLAATSVCMAAAAETVSDNVVRIGVLNDMSGVYAPAAGPGSLEAAKMAAEDFGGEVLGAPIEVIGADHQNKPDVGTSVANRWFDREGVDAIVDLPNSSIALAVQEIGREKGKVIIGGGAATARLTGENCSPTGIHYIYDTYSMAKASALAITENLGKKVYFVTVDYTFGQQLQDAIAHFVKQNGGEIVGSVKHPLGANDFSSYIMQAMSSEADVVVFASAAGDAANAIKTAKEFGLQQSGKNSFAPLVMIPDIKGIGAEVAAGTMLISPFYWNKSEESAAWSERYFERMNAMPSMAQAGAYSYVMHYLKAVEKAGTDNGVDVTKAMKELPVNDWFAEGYIREDGRMVHDQYLVKVKSPGDANHPWDLFELVETIPGEEAFRPLEQGNCSFIQ